MIEPRPESSASSGGASGVSDGFGALRRTFAAPAVFPPQPNYRAEQKPSAPLSVVNQGMT